VIVIQATDQRLSVLARATGRRLWSARIEGLGAGGPLLAADAVYTAGTSGQVTAFSLRTGRALWQRMTAPVVGPLALGPSQLVVATGNGRVYALSPTTGSELWRRDLQGVLRTGATLTGNRLTIATDDSLVQLDAATGARVRATAARGFALAPPASAGGTLVYASPDGFVAAYDEATLTQRWSRETDPILGSPAIARDTVFAVTISGNVLRIPVGGGPLSTIPLGVTVRASPAPRARGLLVATVAGEILWIASEDTLPAWKVRVDGPLDQAPVVDRGLLIFADGRGRIHAWR
jgi:outer membrane protein assembly factor BamB